MPESSYQRPYVRGLESAASMIESMIDEIKEYWEDDDQSISAPSVGANGPGITTKSSLFMAVTMEPRKPSLDF